MKTLLRVTSLCCIILLMFIILFLGFRLGNRYVNSQNERFSQYDLQSRKDKTLAVESEEENGKNTPAFEITQDTPGAIMLYVNRGDSAKEIAKQLQAKGVIKHPILFEILSKLNGFDGGYQYGTHFVRKNMPYDELMFMLTQQPSTSKILFREGLSYKEMKQVMKEKGLVFDEALMDDMVEHPKKYNLSTSILENLNFNSDRQHLLQGYLFPDTYTFDLNTDAESILETMLENMGSQILPEQYERAKKLNMTFDEVITLASIIEKEAGNLSEMYKISRVFHNRLDQDMPLQSCATINYIRSENNLPPVLIVSQTDLDKDDPYNTYLHKGLPPGPICNPGLEAIRAALYPDTSEKDLLFFSATGKGDNVFAATFDGHLQNIEKYLLPSAKENGFTGDVVSKDGTVYSEGGDISAVSDP